MPGPSVRRLGCRHGKVDGGEVDGRSPRPGGAGVQRTATPRPRPAAGSTPKSQAQPGAAVPTHLAGHRERSPARARAASAGWHAGDVPGSAGRVRGPVPLGLLLSCGFRAGRTRQCLLGGLKVLNCGVRAGWPVPRTDTQRPPLEWPPTPAGSPGPHGSHPPSHHGQVMGDSLLGFLKIRVPPLQERPALQTDPLGRRVPPFRTAVPGGHPGAGPSPTEFTVSGPLWWGARPVATGLIIGHICGPETRMPRSSHAPAKAPDWLPHGPIWSLPVKGSPQLGTFVTGPLPEPRCPGPCQLVRHAVSAPRAPRRRQASFQWPARRLLDVRAHRSPLWTRHTGSRGDRGPGSLGHTPRFQMARPRGRAFLEALLSEEGARGSPGTG